MELLLWAIITLFAVAAVTDRVLTEDAVRAWRDSTLTFRRRLRELDAGAAMREANRWFGGLFDAIYGERFVSRRRFIGSCLSSTFALTFIILLLGWLEEMTNIRGGGDVMARRTVLDALMFGFALNLIPDYLSLQETRWVLKRAEGARPLVLSGWFVFDLAATTAIFVVWCCLLWLLLVGPLDLSAAFDWVLGRQEPANLETQELMRMAPQEDGQSFSEAYEARIQFSIVGAIVGTLIFPIIGTIIGIVIGWLTATVFSIDTGPFSSTGLVPIEFFSGFSDAYSLLPFFLTTFFTSALWFLFVLVTIFIRASQRVSPFLGVVIAAIGESRAPARTSAGLLAIGLFLGYGVVKAAALFLP